METSSRHRPSVLAVLLAVTVFAAAPAALAGPGHVNFTFGQKIFESGDFPDGWDPLNKQAAWGVEAAFGPGAWPVQIGVFWDRAHSEKNATLPNGVGGTVDGQIETQVNEFGLGLTKTFGEKKIRPYIGAGGVYAVTDITARQQGTTASTDANGFGFWGGAGAYYRIGSSFNLGGGARYTSATVDYDLYEGTTISYPAFDLNAGGFEFHALIGWSWPKLTP